MLLQLSDLAAVDPVPSRALIGAVRVLAGAWFAAPRAVTLHVQGPLPPPHRPVVFAANHTHSLDFLPLRWALDRRGLGLVTWIKPRAYRDRISALLFARSGNIPVVSRGYVIAEDAERTLGRRPTEDEYRALRDHVDHGVALPALEAMRTLAGRPRDLLGRRFDPGRERYSDAVHATFHAAMRATLAASRRAVLAGQHLHIYPQGTVSARLTPARTGVSQAAAALGLPIVPVGISGAPAALAGGLRRAGGPITLRFGPPMDPPRMPGHEPFDLRSERRHRAALAAAAARLTDALDALLEPAHRRDPHAAPPRAAVARFV